MWGWRNGVRAQAVEPTEVCGEGPQPFVTIEDFARTERSRGFGIADGHEQTLEEVGQTFGITRERIRQLEARALDTLRSPARRQELPVLLEG